MNYLLRDTGTSQVGRSDSDSSAASVWDTGFQTCSRLQWEWGRGRGLQQLFHEPLLCLSGSPQLQQKKQPDQNIDVLTVWRGISNTI